MRKNVEAAEADDGFGVRGQNGLRMEGNAEARCRDHLNVVCAVARANYLRHVGAGNLREHFHGAALAVRVENAPARGAADFAGKHAVRVDNELVADRARHPELLGGIARNLHEAARNNVGGDAVAAA